MGTINYLKNFIRDVNVASVAPTSGFGVKRISRKIDFSRDVTIVEFGPGDGVITKALMQRLTPASRLIAIEANPHFAAQLDCIQDHRFCVVRNRVEQLEGILEKHGIDTIDYVVSGIPFSFIKPATKHAILETVGKMMKPGGAFIAYQTSKHLLPYLEAHFEDVSTEFEFINIPPICIYEAKCFNNNHKPH